MNWIDFKAPIDYVSNSLLNEKDITLAILREDLNHEFISGNKYRKLKYNILEAKKLGYQKILTFGGAYSNHIAATAAAAKLNHLEAVGIIRGEEISELIQQNATLRFAQAQGMQFKFVSREEYRLKDQNDYLNQLKSEFPGYYIIPEGGTNSLAIKGCEEILYDECFHFDYITTAIGTAGTITGILNSSDNQQNILGFPALKSDYFSEEICKLTERRNFKIINDYHFGGYGKVDDFLIEFINNFKKTTSIPLDPIYTGKMMYGILNLIEADYFKKGSKILAIHTGGLQGIEGINQIRKKKNKTIIQ